MKTIPFTFDFVGFNGQTDVSFVSFFRAIDAAFGLRRSRSSDI